MLYFALFEVYSFPLSEDVTTSEGVVASPCTGFCDANWGPQDASVPRSNTSLCSVSLPETRSICGPVLFMMVQA